MERRREESFAATQAYVRDGTERHPIDAWSLQGSDRRRAEPVATPPAGKERARACPGARPSHRERVRPRGTFTSAHGAV